MFRLQVFFSGRSPLLRWNLPLLHKWLYTNGALLQYNCNVTEHCTALHGMLGTAGICHHLACLLPAVSFTA